MQREVCTVKRLAQVKGRISESKYDMVVVERDCLPAGANDMFGEVLQKCSEGFEVEGSCMARGGLAAEDIHYLLSEFADDMGLEGATEYEGWVQGMVQVLRCFCGVMGTDGVSFWLGSARGCKHYHMDAMPMRMLVTYYGAGTEWVPDAAVDRGALEEHNHSRIVTDRSAVRSMDAGDVALFRGDANGYNGVVHRTPHKALDGRSSILLRLDHPSLAREPLSDSDDGMD